MTVGGPRWPGLDGLRGVAAVAVLFFHAQLGFAHNGYVGVDVFFALSGFLITSILLGEIDRTGRVSFRRFYVRRALRLLPALAAACITVVAVGVAAGRAGEFTRGALAALVYVANWWMYTGRPAPLLEHTWTLAIEEHFYAVWPILLTALVARKVWMRAVAVAVALALLVLIFTSWPEPITDVRGTYLRGFPIIWGSLLAWAVRHPRLSEGLPGIRPIGSAALLALLAVLLIPWTLPERWLTGPSSITGVLSVLVLVGVVLAPRGAAARALSWAPLRWAGTRSYGMYLYHFPVLSLLRHQVGVGAGPEWSRMVLGIVVTFVVTELSFRWLESPFLRLKGRFATGAPPVLFNSHGMSARGASGTAYSRD